MFKLESYITPIILNHVAKYVKNIRPEDSQVSLWEGEVAFQNLDLRLDVLEEELNLPFEFLSGHVHELSIQVPWMKIASEPIKITINTIEFVLKLKDLKAEATSSPRKTEKKKKISKIEDGSQPQGYMPGLVNKIINNIVINCHNIILKYVEEDIVVSMNIQLLSFSSADESWKPAFTDIHPVRVFMRKLVQVSDLTICLDKRNAAGQIDVCQEPILYRCSLEVRIVRKYNTNTVHLSSTTRIAIFTKLMEMNVSSMQFPMAMRLFKLLLALKAGELKSKSTTDVHDEEADIQEGNGNASQSYFSWAWNLIPNFSFPEPEEDENIEEDTSGQLLDIGIYIEALNFTLKSSEFITDSIVGATKKIRYSPIVKLVLGGIYSETVIVSNKNWSNTKAGCSSIAIEPLDAYKDEESEVSSLLTTATLSHKTFLDRGLFDEMSVEKDWTPTSICEYNDRVTEEYLLYRSPVIAFDLVEYKVDPEDDASSTELEENDTNRIRVVYRFLASSITLRYSQTYSRIADVIKDLIGSYDYPPYTQDKTDVNGSPKLHPPLLDDFDSLMIGVPLKTYKFYLKAIKFEFHPKTEPLSTKPLKKSSIIPRRILPHFKLSIDHVEGKWTTPLDPDKLVHTTCQLPDKPIELLNACYENSQIRFKNISLDLEQATNSSKLFNIPKGSVNFGNLIQPTLWKNEEVPVRKLDVSFDSVILEFSKCELVTAIRLMSLLSEFNDRTIQLIMQPPSIKELESVTLRNQLTKFNVEVKKYFQTTMFRGSLKLLQSQILRSDDQTADLRPENALLVTTGGPRNRWLEWYLQIPNDCPNNECTKSVMALWIEKYNLVVDENLVDFLKYMEMELPSHKESTPDISQRPPLLRPPSKKSLQSERVARRVCCPEETIHVSSERDEKNNIEASREKELQEKFSFSKILPFIQTMVMRIEIGRGNMHITSGLNKTTSFTEIALPKFLFSSSSGEHIDRYNVQNELQNQNGKPLKDAFPWTCGICDFGIQNTLNNTSRAIIHPIQTSITVAMTHKKETVSVGKVEQQQQQPPKAVEEIEAEKSKQTQLSSPTLSPPETELSLRAAEDYRRRTPVGGSISARGRSPSTDSEKLNKPPEKKKSYLQEAVETVFLGRRKSQTREIVAISLHADTSPIHLEFDSERTRLTKDHLSLLLKIVGLLGIVQRKETAQEQDEIQIITNAEENPNIKDFLEMDTNSESSLLSLDKSTSKFVTSILLQWTITRFTVELEASQKTRCKLVLDMEDLISSVDKREEFTKFTSKIGTFNTRLFEAGAENEFVLSDRLRIKMQADSTQSPLFNMIITTVGVKDFFKRIGAKRKEADLCRAISEVIVKMEAIEMIVDMDKVAILAPSINALSGATSGGKDVELKTKTVPKPSTVCELPMFHLDSKGFTIYMPTETKKSWCDVAILKVGSIKVSPNLENPLQRCPIRADVYQKAAQMGILGIPGSIIEDRQYEITLQNISAATGNWNEILSHMKEHANNFHNTNPAFEWNNQSRRTSLELRNIFSNFTFIITYAPCITCNNALICGQAIEFNCSNDLVVSLTSDQLTLLSCIVNKLENVSKSSGKQRKVIKPTTKKPSKSISQTSLRRSSKPQVTEVKPSASFHSIDTILDSNQRVLEDTSENPVTDSGFSSTKRSVTRKITSCSLQTSVRQLPHTTSFVAGVFIVNLYKYKRVIDSNPQDGAPSVVETLTPLITINLNQPSFLISQTIYEVTKRFSLFNLSVSLYPAPDPPEESILQDENIEPIPEILFDTKRGDLGSSGIPPPLFVLNSHITKSKKLEIDLSFSKPGTVRLSENSLANLTKHLIFYYEALLENPCLNVRSEKPIIRATKIQMMKHLLFKTDRFSLKIDMFSLKYSEANKYNFKASLVDVRWSTKFLSRPEKMNAKGSIGGFFLRSDNRIILHPIGVKCNVDFVQESWNRLPLVTTNVKFNVIRCDVGVEVVKNYIEGIKALNTTMEVSNSLWEAFLQRRCGDAENINRERLLKIYLPNVESKKMAEPKEEFYQDDLRAGAFQFVEMASDTFLPTPYQIQIIKKNYGIICWRYPQPRKMNKIHIFPVPMEVSNPIRIKCRMEYFSDAHESFLHFCDFWLSETVSKAVELPEREVTANIWRVVILQSLVSINRECFDTSEEDEELRSIVSIGIDEILNSVNKESDFILHPKVLVACMRIDTVFKPSVIPKFQILLNIADIQVNLQNHQNILSKLPSQLKKFKIAESNKPINQTFLSLGIEKISIHASFHTLKNYSVHSELTIGVKCLDYGYLNLFHIIEPSNISGYCKINGAVESSIVADKLKVNLGPSVLHNLMCAKHNWEGYFQSKEGDRRSCLISKFIVVNRTQKNITFGQSSTSERILLQPREGCKYSFHSVYFGQELTFYTFDGETEHASSSVAITLDFPANSDSIYKYTVVDCNCLIVRTKRLSSTQYYILIKGQIEMISMVDESFLLEFDRDDKKTEDGETHLEKKGRASFIHNVFCDSNISIRLRLEGDRGKGQTGNIPLKSNKNYPWLVKVPVKGSEKFISYWVRIIREDISDLLTDTFHPQRILVTIWSIFEIRSMMTCPVTALENSTNRQFHLEPKGMVRQLSVPATHQTDHRISFINEFQSASDFNLTLKAIDWSKFFWYDEEIWTIDKAISELSKPVRLKWPLCDDEELLLTRTCMDYNPTSLLFKCFPSREFSCTLRLEVAPWGTFINATGQTIAIQHPTTKESVEIFPNAIAMLPLIKSEFTIAILNNDSRILSLPIVFDKSVENSKRKCYRLNENDSVDVVVFKSEQILKFNLKFRTENERNIFVLKPKYVIANMTKRSIQVVPFALDHKENVSRKDITALASKANSTVRNITTSEYSIGICIDGFYDLNVGKTNRSTDSAFVFFACIKMQGSSEITIPIALMHPFNRKCFSLQQNESSIPFAASLLEKDGQYFINVFEDTSPLILVNNQTDLTLLVAQTNASENSPVSNTIPEYDGKHFEWYQVLRQRSALYYTPPTTYVNFPDVELHSCNLSVALYNDNHNKKNIKWSKSIPTETSWEKFLHVPAHGDVKIVVCHKHRVIRVSILYIAQQLEFSVKDLRSRLLTPQQDDSPENVESKTKLSPSDTFEDELLQRVNPTTSSKCIHQLSNPTSVSNSSLNVRLSINEINVNIFVECKTVDYLKKEIFALCIDDFLVTYDNTNRMVKLVLANLQIDNQLFSSGNYDFPVVVCSQQLYKRSSNCPSSVYLMQRCNEDCRPNNMIEISTIFYDDEMKIRSIACRITPIRAYIEDTYLNDLLDYLVECAPSNVVCSLKPENYYVNLESGEFLIPKDIVAQALYVSEPLKIQYFRIDSTSVMLSVHTCVRLYIALDHSPLQFSTYERRDVLTLPLRFGHTLGMHYLSGALFGAGWVVGSLEMLGSPSGLARSFSLGLKDFVSMPVQGLLRGPWGFIVGVTQGSASLLRNITAGTVNSVSKLAASVSRNLDRLTLDPEHIQRTEALRRCRPQGFTEGFTQGITGLGISILGAVGGIARHTLEARSPAQVVAGMGKGIFGALAKPISGAAELLALTGQGVLHTVGFNAMPLQRAPSVPRNIAAQISEQKVWNLLLSILAKVLEKDQILFYHEVTLVVNDKMRSGSVFLTSTILALFEAESNKFSFIHPTDKLQISSDANDKTLLNISIKYQYEEGSFYTIQRIMSFLRTSDSFDEILTKDTPHSFYISEHLGQYLIEYLRIINLTTS